MISKESAFATISAVSFALTKSLEYIYVIPLLYKQLFAL